MQAKAVIESVGIRPSIQRMAIMNYLMEKRSHPTVEEIFLSLSPSIPTLSKTTVYNTLRLFVDSGIVQMLTIDEQNSRYDADTSVHVHFLCKECGKVYDLPTEVITYLHPEVVEGHVVEERYHFFKGVCKECSKE